MYSYSSLWKTCSCNTLLKAITHLFTTEDSCSLFTLSWLCLCFYDIFGTDDSNNCDLTFLCICEVITVSAILHSIKYRNETTSQNSLISLSALLLSLLWCCAAVMATLVAQLVKNPPVMWETWVQSLIWSVGWEDLLEENGYRLQHSGLENSMDFTVYAVPKSWNRLNDF